MNMNTCICYVKIKSGGSQVLLCKSDTPFSLPEAEQFLQARNDVIEAHCSEIPAELRAPLRRLTEQHDLRNEP